MPQNLLLLLIAIATAIAVAAGVFAVRSQAAAQAAEQRLARTLLEPVQALIEQNQKLMAQAQGEPAAGSAATDLLDAYLARIRADGVPARAAARQRLDQIATKQVAALALLTAYAPNARTPALQREVDRFREHTTAWQGRWHSVMAVFMGGGNLAAAPVEFPKDLPARLRDELAAAR